MPATYKDGKLVSSTSAAPSKSSKSKSIAQATTTTGGSGGKGGGKPDIASNKVSGTPYDTDKSYGYYNDQGKYVSAFQDMLDGGGKNQSGNYFEGAGAISSMLNAAKVRPAGAARERDAQGNYVVDRADIGYRDINDWFDRGGPQASGGKFQGLGTYSGLANLIFGEQGQRTPYADQTAAAAQAVQDLQNPMSWGVKLTPAGNPPKPAGLLRPRARPASVDAVAASRQGPYDYMFNRGVSNTADNANYRAAMIGADAGINNAYSAARYNNADPYAYMFAGVPQQSAALTNDPYTSPEFLDYKKMAVGLGYGDLSDQSLMNTFQKWKQRQSMRGQ